MSTTASGNSIVFNDMQPLKALLPISFNEGGSRIEVSDLHLQKALSPMSTTASGNSIVSNDSQPLKANPPIFFNEDDEGES
ncbi:hypothetical protein ACA910_004654 [Epithemia clementina (nom. ined.)]